MNFLPTKKSKNSHSQTPHPLILFVLFPVVLLTSIGLLLYFSSFPSMVFLIIIGAIMALYSFYKAIKSDFQQSTSSIYFLDRDKFQHEFITYLQEHGFQITEQTDNSYSIKVNKSMNIITLISSTIPAFQVNTQMIIGEKSAEISGAKFLIDMLNKITTDYILMNKKLEIPY